MNSELIAVIDYWVREKGIERQTLIAAVQDCLVGAAKKALGPTRELHCSINPKSGEIKAFARLVVVEKVTSPRNEISLTEAKTLKPDAQCGDEIDKEVTPNNFGRIAAQHAKQNLIQLIRRIEKSKIYDEFKDRVGEVVDGTVRRFEKGDVIVDLGRFEAVMPSRERVPNENYDPGEHFHFYVKSVENRQNGLEIILSRSDVRFVKKLFEIEIAEIKDRTIEIKGIAREPGVRTKIAVYTRDSKVDPVGACVGVRGQRVKNIVRELNNEKIDIIEYDSDITRYVANALAPARLLSYEVNREKKQIQVWTTEDQLSIAIGKRGHNARLTSQLTGWRVDIDSEAPEPSGFDTQVANAILELEKIPGITEDCARKLVLSGFTNANAILQTDLADLQSIEGIGDMAESIIEAVRAAVVNSPSDDK